MLPTIDFRQIRSHEGTQDRAFEELCCQLAHLEADPDGDFIRKGKGGDAGVECFWRLSSGNEYGWQAKYLFKLGDPEVSQLNKSFQEAFAKHASLCRYFVCLPFDLSDARAKRQGKHLKSQLDRWEELVRKWTAQALENGRSIEIILWDAFRISGLLADDRPQYAGKVLYWFGAPALAPAVLRERVEVAIENLGPRYTPALHVDLPISHVLDGLCWDESFRERAREMRRALHQAATRCRREAEDQKPVQEPLGRAISVSRRLADALEVLAEIAPTTRTVESLRGLAAAASRDVESLHLGLAELQHRVDRDDEDPTDSSGGQHGRTLNNARYAALRLRSSVEETKRFLASHQVSASATRALLVRGEAGMGKSHLLADVVRERVRAGLPAIIVLGQHVRQGDVWSAVRKALDMPEQPTAHILGALDAAAEANRSRALIAVDAINEGGGADVWRDQLAGFLREARALPRVAVVLTCRTAFERRCAPEHIQESDLFRIEHRGFAGHANEALQAYFDRQGLARPSAPSLSPEFHNPLFLKTVAKALKLTGVDALPRGLRGVKQIMDYYGQCLDEAVTREMGVPGRRKLGGRALRVIAKLLAELTHEWVLRAPVIEELDAITDGRGRELLDLLVSEGALLDEVHYFDENDDEGVDTVRFTYQRFSDHYIAERLLENHLDSKAPQKSFAPGTPLGDRFRGESLWDNAGIAEAMAVQVPGVCRREFIAILAPEDYHLVRLAVDFLASIVWRDPGDFTDETLEWLNRAPEFVHGHAIEDTLLRVATEPGHPYNADFLHKNLIGHPMPDRDAFWSTYLAISYDEDSYNEDQLGPAHEIIDWSWYADKDKVETERLRLCSIALAWMFSTPHRKLRDRATKGLVSILVRQAALITPLLERFATIDDPYIQERLYAAAYGAALNHRDCATARRAADAAFRLIFAAGKPPPHLRLRDYARGIVELGAHLRARPGSLA